MSWGALLAGDHRLEKIDGTSEHGQSPGMTQPGLPTAFTGMNWGGMALEGLSQP